MALRKLRSHCPNCLHHAFELIWEMIEADNDEAGAVVLKCANCQAQFTETEQLAPLEYPAAAAL